MNCGGVPDDLRGLEVIREDVEMKKNRSKVLDGCAAAWSTSLGLPGLLSQCN